MLIVPAAVLEVDSDCRLVKLELLPLLNSGGVTGANIYILLKLNQHVTAGLALHHQPPP